jgi:DNA-binding transcriptional regulator YiaG
MIKAIRKQFGISQKEFSTLIGVSLASVAGWEQKKGQLKKWLGVKSLLDS